MSTPRYVSNDNVVTDELRSTTSRTIVKRDGDNAIHILVYERDGCEHYLICVKHQGQFYVALSADHHDIGTADKWTLEEVLEDIG